MMKGLENDILRVFRGLESDEHAATQSVLSSFVSTASTFRRVLDSSRTFLKRYASEERGVQHEFLVLGTSLRRLDEILSEKNELLSDKATQIESLATSLDTEQIAKEDALRGVDAIRSELTIQRLAEASSDREKVALLEEETKRLSLETTRLDVALKSKDQIIRSLNERNSTELKSRDEKYADTLAEKEAEFERRISEIKESHGRILEEKQTAHEQAVSGSVVSHEKEVRDLSERLQSTEDQLKIARDLRDSVEVERSTLRRDLDVTKARFAELEKVKAVLDSKMQTLEENQLSSRSIQSELQLKLQVAEEGLAKISGEKERQDEEVRGLRELVKTKDELIVDLKSRADQASLFTNEKNITEKSAILRQLGLLVRDKDLLAAELRSAKEASDSYIQELAKREGVSDELAQQVESLRGDKESLSLIVENQRDVINELTMKSELLDRQRTDFATRRSQAQLEETEERLTAAIRSTVELKDRDRASVYQHQLSSLTEQLRSVLSDLDSRSQSFLVQREEGEAALRESLRSGQDVTLRLQEQQQRTIEKQEREISLLRELVRPKETRAVDVQTSVFPEPSETERYREEVDLLKAFLNKKDEKIDVLSFELAELRDSAHHASVDKKIISVLQTKLKSSQQYIQKLSSQGNDLRLGRENMKQVVLKQMDQLDLYSIQIREQDDTLEQMKLLFKKQGEQNVALKKKLQLLRSYGSEIRQQKSRNQELRLEIANLRDIVSKQTTLIKRFTAGSENLETSRLSRTTPPRGNRIPSFARSAQLSMGDRRRRSEGRRRPGDERERFL